MFPSRSADGSADGAADLASAPEGLPQRIETLPLDPVVRERLVALGLHPGDVVTVLRRGQPGGILHVSQICARPA